MDSVFNKRKRALEDDVPNKRQSCAQSSFNILHLSDCTLLNILKFMDATSLYMLGQTCTRFKRLVSDESLWIYVDARSNPNTTNKALYCWESVNRKTRVLLLAGERRSDFLISLDVFFNNKLPNLTVLALEHQCIKYCRLKEFPESLQELSLKHSFIPQHTSFFRFAHERMANLKTLILDHCQWFLADSLISLSRLPNLEILSLYMCKKLGDDDIGDVSLAGMFGFQSLKVIDLRFTGLGNNFIKSFYKRSSLQCIYFQCFSSTYQFDRQQRKLDISNGLSQRENSYMSDDEANNDSSRLSFRKRFNAEEVISVDFQGINDATMQIFTTLKVEEGNKPRPKSFLYLYPYPECTCGFFNKESGIYGPVNMSEGAKELNERSVNTEQTKTLNASSSSDDDGDDKQRPINLNKKVYFIRPKKYRICNYLVFDTCVLPDWCQTESNRYNCNDKWLYVREPRNDFEIDMLEHTDKHYKFQSMPGCKGENCEWDCTEYYSTGNESNVHLIVVARTADGRMVHYSSHRNENDRSNYPTFENLCEDEAYALIVSLLDYLIGFRHNNICDILFLINQCLRRNCYYDALSVPQLMNDQFFMRDIIKCLSQFQYVLGNNGNQILSYHTSCFLELILKLARSNSHEKKKEILILFFRNLLCSIKDSNLEIASKENSEEILNLPGPSGYHAFKNKCDENVDDKKHVTNDGRSSTNASSKPKTKQHIVFNTVPPNINICVNRNNIPEGSILIRMPNDMGYRRVQDIEQVARNIKTNIKELSLRGYPVTNNTLMTLKELDLDLLDVTRTNITATAIKEFMLSNPQCRLIHEAACTCRPNLHF